MNVNLVVAWFYIFRMLFLLLIKLGFPSSENLSVVETRLLILVIVRVYSEDCNEF